MLSDKNMFLDEKETWFQTKTLKSLSSCTKAGQSRRSTKCDILTCKANFIRHVLYFGMQQWSDSKWIFCEVERNSFEMFPLRSLPLSVIIPFFLLLFEATAWLADLFLQIPTPPMIQTAVGEEQLMRSIVQWVGLQSVHVSCVHISPGASSFFWPLKTRLLYQA